MMNPSTANETVHHENDDITDRIIKNCRLSKLNFDCLEKIFQYLITNDLIHLCQINPLVCDAIKERAASKHHIEFTEWNQLWSTESIFTEIGADIRSMAINEWNFPQSEAVAASTTVVQPINQFLAMLIKHCTPNRIQGLSLNFDFSGLNETLLNEARPYFSQLQKVIFGSIGHRHSNTDHDQLLATMIDNAKHLSSIQLENTSSNGDWLCFKHMKNAEHLTLVNSSIHDDKNWHQYLENQPKLTTFAWVNSQIPNYSLCENIARHCTELERFFDVQFRIDDEKYFQRDFVMSRYNYFTSFSQLKCVQITAYTESGRDLIGAFMALARRNTVERLGIYFLKNPTFKYTLDDMDYATQEYPDIESLKSLEIENCTSCGFWNDIIVKFLKCSVNLHELSISGHDRLNSIQFTCIALAPQQLDVLKINRLTVADLPQAFKTISIKRMNNKNCNTLKIFINPEQNMQLDGCEFHNLQFEVIEG